MSPPTHKINHFPHWLTSTSPFSATARPVPTILLVRASPQLPLTSCGVGTPLRMTRNKPRSKLSGKHLFLLDLFKIIWPHSSYYECIVFIANESEDERIFSLVAVSRAPRKLGYTTKITLTVAYQEFTTRGILSNSRCFGQSRGLPEFTVLLGVHWLMLINLAYI